MRAQKKISLLGIPEVGEKQKWLFVRYIYLCSDNLFDTCVECLVITEYNVEMIGPGTER